MRCIATAGLGAVLAVGATMAAAQRPAYQPAHAAAPAAAAAAAAAVKEIYVDEKCRLLPDPASVVPGKKLKPKKDWDICHLEAVFDTHHRAETVVGNELQRADVEVYEQQYVLQNVYTEPVAFLVEQPVAKGWTLESDPPPVRVAGHVATFRAMAQPGEIVRLHVGMRYTESLKPKVLRPGAQAPARPAPNAPPPAGSIRQPASGVPAPANGNGPGAQ